MSTLVSETQNTPASVKTWFASTGSSWLPVLLFLPGRFVFAFIAQAVTAGVLAIQGSTDAWREAAGWWTVHGTLTDILCLLALFWLMRREGLTLGALFGARGKTAVKQLAWIPLYLLAVAPAAALARAITLWFYGDMQPPMFTVVDLSPAWGWYTILIWPLIWSIVEELVYLGYLMPRIEALSGKTWVAVVVVIFFWGLQHLAMPWIADDVYLTWRLLSSWAAVSLFPVAFVLGRRRLIPLMGVHYIANLATAFIVVYMP